MVNVLIKIISHNIWCATAIGLKATDLYWMYTFTDDRTIYIQRKYEEII